MIVFWIPCSNVFHCREIELRHLQLYYMCYFSRYFLSRHFLLYLSLFLFYFLTPCLSISIYLFPKLSHCTLSTPNLYSFYCLCQPFILIGHLIFLLHFLAIILSGFLITYFLTPASTCIFPLYFLNFVLTHVGSHETWMVEALLFVQIVAKGRSGITIQLYW